MKEGLRACRLTCLLQEALVFSFYFSSFLFSRNLDGFRKESTERVGRLSPHYLSSGEKVNSEHAV